MQLVFLLASSGPESLRFHGCGLLPTSPGSKAPGLYNHAEDWDYREVHFPWPG